MSTEAMRTLGWHAGLPSFISSLIRSILLSLARSFIHVLAHTGVHPSADAFRGSLISPFARACRQVAPVHLFSLLSSLLFTPAVSHPFTSLHPLLSFPSLLPCSVFSAIISMLPVCLVFCLLSLVSPPQGRDFVLSIATSPAPAHGRCSVDIC